MEFEQALALVNDAMSATFSRLLSDAELALFKGAWHGQTYDVIAEESGYASSYFTRIVGPKFWKNLSQALGEKVSKTSFRAAIEHRQQQLNQAPSTLPAVPAPSSATTSHPLAIDWGEAPDVTAFYGRQTELETLTQWVITHRCRLIGVLGMGGIGKTTLTAKFIETLEARTDYPFTHIIWRSLRNGLPLVDWLDEVIPFISNQQDTEASPKRLLYWLRQSRCLLILDNMETILHSGERAGSFCEDYADYGDLLKLLAETRHQSCVVLTSREKPAVVGAFEGVDLPVRSQSLTGSPEAASALLDAKGLVGTVAEKQSLGERYSYSPLALKIVATSIQSLFEGRIDLFLAEDTLVFNGLQRLLDQQFERLTALEKTMMIWLAINREWTSISELVDDIQPTVARIQVLETLESLSWRSLIEKQAGRYTQQPVVMEYVTGQFIQQVLPELNGAELSLFLSHALLKTTVKDYIRLSQQRLIVHPIAHQFARNFSARAILAQQIQRLLTTLRQPPQQFSGYGAGNLLNLCIELDVDLAGLDFSHLPIHHAYLQQTCLHQVSFVGATFIHTAFTQTFGNVLAVAFSPNGQLLAASDTNGQIWLWRTDHLEQPYLTWQGHGNWVWSLDFSPDSQFLISGCDDDDDTLKLWDVQTGQHLRTLMVPESRVRTVRWHPQQTLIASSGVDGMVRLWEPETGDCVQTLAGHTNKSSALAWCPQSDRAHILATGSADQTIRTWDTETGDCLWVMDVGVGVFAIAWHPDGNILASGNKNGDVQLWDSHTGALLNTLQGHQKCLWSLAWNRDGRLLASGGDDYSIRLWDTQTGQCLRILQGHQNAVRAVGWQPGLVASPSPPQSEESSELLASGSFDQTVRLWSPRADASLKVLQGYRNGLQALAWHPSNAVLASGGHDRQVRLWNTQTGQCLTVLSGHSQPVWSVAWSQDGQLASSGDDQTICLWHMATNQIDAVLKGHQGSIWDLAWHPTQGTLASASHDQTVRLWNTATGCCLTTLKGHASFVRTVAWSPDGRLLASGSYDQTLRLWDVATGDCLHILDDPENWVWRMAFSPNNKTLATGSTNGDIKLWQVSTGKHIQTLKGHQNSVWSLAWRPNGRTLVSSSHDQTVRIWRISDGQCLQVLKGHTNLIWQMALSPDGKTIASCGSDETIRVWDAVAGTCLKVLRPLRPYEGMNITDVQGLTDAQQINLKRLGAVVTTINTSVSSPETSTPAIPVSSVKDNEPPLRISLFGGLTIAYQQQPLRNLGSSRTQSLLAYLLLHRHSNQSRQQIALALWPDSLDSQARTNLRKELHNLRRHLPQAEAYLEINASQLGWQNQAPFWLDVEDFEQVLITVDNQAEGEAISSLEQAVALYTGDLLPAMYDEWLYPIREKFQQQFSQALAQLVDILRKQEKYSPALTYAERLLRLDPLKEATYQRLMQLHNQLGNRATALQIYHQCMTILRDELGVDPSSKTQEIYRQLLQ
ncbi:wd40 repeat-containing protein [Leptolyngbya sp. Heron Island J]|uniref:WD40 domain-containing protein n=1 Tax=Leptolyngbya sp. Heron Island J TaxID=1385935 RepID=UPI0003B971E9|nr:BTAD domain-containing putative transcriptional regulator [Leptolyngbya sp. Heron Island J]ESA38603.1 wd40 repeat-containing protein [Leptolyngbya sp. Heron Island J]